MNVISTVVLSLAMSADAFAAAIGRGTAVPSTSFRQALKTGVVFGVIEGLTPLIGWALGRAASPYVAAWDHWIAFMLLCGIGMMMIRAATSNDSIEIKKPLKQSLWVLALTGFATSIDAMVVGVGLAFIDANIVVTAAAIGFSTFVLVTLGVMTGRMLGIVAGKRAELFGGLVLIGIGCLILYEHTLG